jgi:hypothetical protein
MAALKGDIKMSLLLRHTAASAACQCGCRCMKVVCSMLLALSFPTCYYTKLFLAWERGSDSSHLPCSVFTHVFMSCNHLLLQQVRSDKAKKCSEQVLSDKAKECSDILKHDHGLVQEY